jgi:hypothetical protein
MPDNQLIETYLEDKKTITHDSKSSAIVTLDREKDLILLNSLKSDINQEFYDYLIRETYKYTNLTKEKGAIIRLAISFMILFKMSIEDVRKLKIVAVQNIFCNRENRFYISLFHETVQNYIKRRMQDLNVLSKSLTMNSDTSNSTDYLFKSSYFRDKPIPRESLTRLLNNFLKDVSKKKKYETLLTTKALTKSDFTDQLWIDSKDIEFVKRKLKS